MFYKCGKKIYTKNCCSFSRCFYQKLRGGGLGLNSKNGARRRKGGKAEGTKKKEGKERKKERKTEKKERERERKKRRRKKREKKKKKKRKKKKKTKQTIH